VADRCGHCGCECRLAHATGPDQSRDRAGADTLRDLSDFLVPAQQSTWAQRWRSLERVLRFNRGHVAFLAMRRVGRNMAARARTPARLASPLRTGGRRARTLKPKLLSPVPSRQNQPSNSRPLGVSECCRYTRRICNLAARSNLFVWSSNPGNSRYFV